MATGTHTINGQPWPNGTVVNVYPAAAQPSGSDGPPAGSPVDSATVASGSVTFSAVTEGQRYVAYASGTRRYFLVQPGSVDLLRPITGLEAQAIREALDAVRNRTEATFPVDDYWLPIHADYNTAIQGACNAAGANGGGRVEFDPSHEYPVATFQVFDQPNLHLVGNGALIKRRAGLVSPDVTGFGMFWGCHDLEIEGLRFDSNNVERFGALNLYGCHRAEIHHNYAFDSNLNASWSTYDHYWIVHNHDDRIPASKVRPQDIRFHHNVCTDVEPFEFDNCDVVECHHNISHNCAGTSAFGSYTVTSGETVTECDIYDNLIVDPRKQGIYFSHEGLAGLNNNTWRGIRIKRNTILHLTATAGPSKAIAVGNFTGSASAGNSYEGIEIEDNVVYRAAALAPLTGPHIHVMQQSGNVFNGTSVRRNKVFANTTDWAIDVRRTAESVVSDNVVRGTATFGMNLSLNVSTVVARNAAKASNTAYQIVSAASSANRVYDNTVFGTPTTRWSKTLDATDYFRDVLPEATATWDPASIADQSQAVVDTTVTGAAVGDAVEISLGSDLLNCSLTGYVRAANSVRAVIDNQSGAPRDIASGTLRICVTKRS